MIIDIFFTIYCCFGAYKGRRHKLPKMTYRLVRNVTAMIGGVGFFRIVRDLLSVVFSSFLADSLGFILGFILAFVLIRKFKKHLITWIENKIGQVEQSKWGAIVGFCTNFFMGSSVIVTTCISDEGPLYGMVSKQSEFARTCIGIIEMYKTFFGS